MPNDPSHNSFVKWRQEIAWESADDARQVLDKMLFKLMQIANRPVIMKIHIVHDIEINSSFADKPNDASLPHPVVQHGASAPFFPKTHPLG